MGVRGKWKNKAISVTNDFLLNNKTVLMNNQNEKPAWMEDELVKSISPKKLEFIGNLFQNSRGKSQKEMMSFLMPMMRKAKQEHLTFTQQEMQAAILAIKKHSTQEELSQIDKILAKADSHMK